MCEDMHSCTVRATLAQGLNGIELCGWTLTAYAHCLSNLIVL